MLLRKAMAGGVAAAASLALGVSAEAAGPRITLNPTQGTPATVVQVKGTGFCGSASCSQAQVVFQGTPVATGIVVASDGTFTASFQPSAGPPGWKTVVGQQKDASGAWITSTPAAFYLVLAPPTPTPTVFPHTPTPSQRPSPSSQPTASGGPGPSGTATPTAQATPTPMSDAPATSGASAWPWLIVGAVGVVVLAGVVVYAYLRRRQS